MTATVPVRPPSSTGLANTGIALPRSEERCVAMAAALEIAPLRPAVFVPGLEHQAAAAILAAGLPGVIHRRRTLHRRLDEHLILDANADTDSGSGVRVMACWDDQAHRVRMHVAEVGAPGLWDRIVAHFTEWEITGRPTPAATDSGAAS
ncbi:hypothetical protein [Amycolatopsis sp. PS_44_ISF1]|uniref:hypothetical protein n=1 Tax=Amycolatopsis sp. PS_44_ISF1 TaxID=2974917 RepID=UPI0028DED656|nr:hypothetical protein [Amycolatopsis sp. PS_44_ISF1]MDT8913530.1 hypothetical protein [Amycolatopsis sp. PS_44_ISF1]